VDVFESAGDAGEGRVIREPSCAAARGGDVKFSCVDVVEEEAASHVLVAEITYRSLGVRTDLESSMQTNVRSPAVESSLTCRGAKYFLARVVDVSSDKNTFQPMISSFTEP
jgi:hypothetical protein